MYFIYKINCLLFCVLFFYIYFIADKKVKKLKVIQKWHLFI